MFLGKRLRVSLLSAAAVLLLMLAVALGAGGCTTDSGDASSNNPAASDVAASPASSVVTSTSRPVTTTTVPTTVAEAETVNLPEPSDGVVFDQYIARQVELFAEALNAAAESPTLDPASDHPELAAYAADAYLEVNFEYIRRLVEEGRSIRPPPESAVGRSFAQKNRISPAMDLDGDMLKVFRCWVQDEDIIDAVSGTVEVRGVITSLAVVTMKRFDDGWKAVFSEVSQRLEGVAGCFLANDVDFPY